MKNKKIFISLFAIIILLIGLNFIVPKAKNYIYRQKIEKENKATIEKISTAEIITKEKPKIDAEVEAITETTPETPKEAPKELQNQAYLKVPFITQAPLQTEVNWTLHEESCEEAATLQAYLYEVGQTMTKDEANTEILNMIEWQKEDENFGTHRDLYADDMQEFITGYYGLTKSEIKIIYDAEIEDIKKIIAGGHPVIVPITGDILNNPYYPYPGYHMLTVIGYTEDRIITNDNGTRRGADFSYDTKIFESAMKDAGGDILWFKLNNESSNTF